MRHLLFFLHFMFQACLYQLLTSPASQNDSKELAISYIFAGNLNIQKKFYVMCTKYLLNLLQVLLL